MVQTERADGSTNTSHCANETGEIVNKKVGMFLEFELSRKTLKNAALLYIPL